MNHLASVTDFFKSPKWGMNLLLGAVCILIPIVGPMVLQGWHITGFWARRDEGDPAEFPPFDFQFFVKYLERGLWPFLVAMVASLVLVPVIMVLFIGPVILMGTLGQHDNYVQQGFPILILLVFAIYLAVMALFSFILTPLTLRASLTQDFGPAFSLRFIRDFIALVWKEQVVSMLFMAGVYLVVMVITVVTCYIGGIFSFPILFYTWHHLQKQLYQLYLARGGAAIPVSLKLADGPPALPF
ncbi:MAG: DUF4013 domain-containing protein [Luteolibacter sp.]